MCDYIYLDGSSATVDSNFLLNWYIDERYLRNKKENQKVFVSVQQITFKFYDDSIESIMDVPVQAELITNLNLKNCYNSKGLYKVLLLCDTSVIVIQIAEDSRKQSTTSNTCNNNNYLIYETDTPSLIQLGLLLINESIQFADESKNDFKCLLKFEYQDK